MQCKRCGGFRVLSVKSHGRDCNFFSILGYEHNGYVPADLGLGCGDDVEFDVCLDCGQLQRTFPIPQTRLERGHINHPPHKGGD